MGTTSKCMCVAIIILLPRNKNVMGEGKKKANKAGLL
jgi:hypothetical protein